MKITSIKPQVKRANRYSIFIDNKYSFSLSENEVSDLKIQIGQELSPDDINQLSDESILGKAKNACFKLLSYRARSEGEIRDYLKRKDYDEELSELVIDFLIGNKFLNDEDFAKQWIETRSKNNHLSNRQLKSELKQKKISDSIINSSFEELEVDEISVIKELINKKSHQTKYKDQIKLMQYLSRKGFSYDKIQIALGRRAE